MKNFVDNILGHNQTLQEHLYTLQEDLTRLSEAGLTVKSSKYVQSNFQLQFLGHIVDSGQISPDFSKIQSVKESRPSSKKQTFLSRTSRVLMEIYSKV